VFGTANLGVNMTFASIVSLQSSFAIAITRFTTLKACQSLTKSFTGAIFAGPKRESQMVSGIVNLDAILMFVQTAIGKSRCKM